MSQNKSEGANGAEIGATAISSKNEPPFTTSSAGKNDNSKTSRKRLNRQKAMEILEHRKILLKRMQLCRKATEARLMLYEKSDADQVVSGNAENLIISSRKRKFTNREIELKSYADLSKYAMSYTVKKAPIKAPPPAPRNISLRTGSTVGNKMKAAVATLTTNVGWISDASSQSSVKGNKKISVSTVPPVSSNAPATQTNTKNAPVSMATALHKAIPSTNDIKSSPVPDVPRTSASITMPAPKNNVKKLNTTTAAHSTGKHLKKKSMQPGKKRSGKQIRHGNNIMSSSEASIAAKKPLHLSGSKGMTQNRREQSHPSRVLCPETERLRRKRRDLVKKIENVMRTTYADTLSKEDTDRKISKRMQVHDNPYSNCKKMSWRTFTEAGSAPCFLPERRKTQWDYVLEEMRWLATDFVEENKWKRASAKTLSAAIMTNHLISATQAKISPSKLRRSTPSSNKLGESSSNVDLVEIKSNREDESMDEDDDTDSGVEEHISNIEFVDPTDEDIKSSKSIAQLINTVVETHWELANTKSNMPPSDEQTAFAYERYHKLRSDDSSSADGVRLRKDCISSAADKDISSNIPGHYLSFEEMQERIQNSVQRRKMTESELSEKFDDFFSSVSDSLEGTKLQIQDSQMEVLQFTEALWKEVEGRQSINGSLISGPIGCGKTFSTCLLLWRRRGKGPQLLLCPGESLFRWRHELRHFSGLNILTFGSSGWFYRGDSNNYMVGSNSNDVILCDFSGAKDLQFQLKESTKPFATVVMDIRCLSIPSSLPFLAESKKHGKQSKRKAGVLEEKQSTYGQIIAQELYNSEWWNNIIEHMLRQHTKSVLVETSGVVNSHPDSDDHKAESTNTIEQSNILSFKVAFLFHEIFQSKHKTFCRRAFWWAKKHLIVLRKMKTTQFDLSGGIRGVLKWLLEAVTHSPELSLGEREENVSSCIPKWTVQTCPLSSTQRDSYERACMFVRGSFQCANQDSNDSFVPASKALLRLRRACFHSDLNESSLTLKDDSKAYSNPRVKNRFCLSCPRYDTDDRISSSQPDIFHAKSLLEKSSKLRQLLIILCKDCGYDVPAKNYLLGAKPTRRGRKSTSGRRKKVLILASLPEVLLLISSFLNAIGIAHELLAPQNCLPPFQQEGIDDFVSNSSESIVSWIHWQQSIIRFDETSLDSGSKSSVLLSSPNSLASSTLGLHASNAEVIISLDEDWSGGCDLSTFSILRKNRTSNMQKTTGRKYIKLIAEETCEHSFLTFEKKTRGKKSIQAVPIMMSTLKRPMLDNCASNTPNVHLILGKNMLRYAGVPLRNVLFSNSLPSGALNGRANLFLALDGHVQAKDECDLTPNGDKLHSLLNDLDKQPKYVGRIGGLQKGNAFGLSVSKIERASITPLVTTQKDVLNLRDPYVSDATSPVSSSSISSCRDAFSLQIQRYLRSTKSLISRIEVTSSRNGNAPKKISKPKVEDTKVDDKGDRNTTSEVSPALMEADSTKSKPEEIISSLIWYDCYEGNDVGSRQNDHELGCFEDNKKRRTNSYVRSYKSIKRKFDGNQGCEALVYFPPLFPGIIQADKTGVNEYNAVEQSLMNRDANQIVPESKKGVDLRETNSKRLRGNASNTPALDISISIQSLTPSQALPTPSIVGKDMANDLMAVSDVDFMDGATDLFDGDFLPDLNITNADEEMMNDALADDAESSENMEVDETVKQDLDEDFGILGSGLLPSLEDSSKAAMRQNGFSNLYSYWLDPFEPLSSVENLFSESPSLDYIILHVKKSTKPGIGMMYRPPSNMQSTPSSFTPKMGPVTSNGNLLKKKKKNGTTDKRNSIGSTSAFIPNSSFDITSSGVHRTSVHSGIMPKEPSMRPERNAPSIFDSFGHCGAPSIRVHHQLQALLDPSRNQMVRSGVISPHHQNSMVLSQCSIRELLPNEHTGDAAKNLAQKQSKSFCRDSLVSFDVDFGPFSVGIVPDTSAKPPKHPTESQIGIKLPMGVKIPKSMGAFTKNVDVWTPQEDNLLNMYAVRFGFNWNVISQALTRKSRISACLDGVTIVNPIRSAKLCKERWDLIKEDSTATVENNGSDQKDSDPNLCVSSDIIIDPKKLKDVEETATFPTPFTGRMTSRLQKLKKASLKTQHLPLTIPGYTSGPNMPPLQIVPSHHSHSNSVQEAIAASAGPSGIVPPRAEMWPLQFLDLTEKQHQEVEKKMKVQSTPARITPQQVLPVRNTHPPSRQNSVPNPGVPHVSSHSLPPRQIPGNPQMSGQRQPSSSTISRTQQQISQPKVTTTSSYAKQMAPAPHSKTKPSSKSKNNGP